jgi:ubiquinol-cytochrome c reductase cytochrome b subunit
VKDIVGVAVFLFFFFAIVFFAPEMGGYFLEQPNFEPANALKTPLHIAPVWYFTPFYTVLRAVPDPWYGTLAMFAAIIILFVLPWLDRNPIKSWRYRTLAHKANLIIFAIVFIVLGWMGVEAVTPAYKELGTRMTEIYFLFFMVIWVHSRPATVNYLMWFGILLAVVVGVDFLRYNPGAPEEAHQIMIQFVWPLAYLAITLLMPAFISKWNQEKPVPERVTG